MKTLPHPRPAVRGARRGRRSRRAGFTLIEVMIASGILLMGLLALTSTSVVVHSLDTNDDARRLASTAMRDAIDRLHAVSASAVEDEDGWAPTLLQVFGPGGTLEDTFDVQGLAPWAGAPSVGRIRLITDETLTDEDLGVTIGMPRDLDGDGNATSTNVTATAQLLPAIVTVRWATSSGDREVRQGFFVVGM